MSLFRIVGIMVASAMVLLVISAWQAAPRLESLKTLLVCEVLVENGRGSDFVDALNALALEKGFDFVSAQMNPSPTSVTIHMSRDDLGISVANPWEPDRFTISIYQWAPGNFSVAKDEILQALQTMVAGIPGGVLQIEREQ